MFGQTSFSRKRFYALCVTHFGEQGSQGGNCQSQNQTASLVTRLPFSKLGSHTHYQTTSLSARLPISKLDCQFQNQTASLKTRQSVLLLDYQPESYTASLNTRLPACQCQCQTVSLKTRLPACQCPCQTASLKTRLPVSGITRKSVHRSLRVILLIVVPKHQVKKNQKVR